VLRATAIVEAIEDTVSGILVDPWFGPGRRLGLDAQPSVVFPCVASPEITPPVETPATDVEDSEKALRRITAGTARMATATGVRQVLTTGVMAVTAAIVARCLGPHSFGVFTGGTAAFNLCLMLSDFGFSLVLSRELSKRADDQEQLMGTALSAQLAWCGVLTLVLVILGIAAGGERGRVMLVLSPGLAFLGLAVTRQIFSVRFRAAPLLVMDVSTTVLQCVVMATLALLHASILLLALNLSLWTCLSSYFALWLARREVRFAFPSRAQIARFVRAAAPQGLASILASLYFSIDLTLLGWLVSPTQLGHYGAAVRLLTVIVMIPGYIMIAGVPGLSQSSERREELSTFASMLARWIALTALPLGAGLAVFARPAILIVFGHGYLAAVPLIRILMLAALLSFVSNVSGIVMATLGLVRPQLVFTGLSLVVNVAGNLLLDPRYGVTAAAWLTVGTEVIIATYGVVTLARRISYPIILREVWRPSVAVAAAASVGLCLGANSLFAIVAAGLVFAAVLMAVGGAPAGLTTRLGRLLSWR
jgi:O-antigen/teichoic acid export membrane protein